MTKSKSLLINARITSNSSMDLAAISEKKASWSMMHISHDRFSAAREMLEICLTPATALVSVKLQALCEQECTDTIASLSKLMP